MGTRSISSFRATGDGLKRLAELGKELSQRPGVKLGVFASDAARGGVTKIKRQTTKERIPGFGVTKTKRITSVTHGVGASEDITNVEIGIIHEFGTGDGRIPERSWLRGAYQEYHLKWQKLMEQLLKLIIEGKLDTTRALGLLGQQASADIRRRIRTGKGVLTSDGKGLAASTILAKGSSRPLLDTAQFVNSITYEVEANDR